ncbi:hypothetical protein RIN66_11475 [Hafnia alvei]|uniref:hypothetical protein n=1 Tax=Hafnia alvei TaxID=569 RepID=UPI0028BDD8CC|nr:hypothetical protein [Hafnia alvei]WNN50721.1 hypothetical protein RIN66_11475 [Hafnia alvei]
MSSLIQTLLQRINMKGQWAVLYLNDQDKPAFIVNDLKLGANKRGGVGVWLESGTVLISGS